MFPAYIMLIALSLIVIAASIAYLVYFMKERSKKKEMKTIFVKGGDEAAVLFELLGTNQTHTIKMEATVCEEYFLQNLQMNADVTEMKYIRGTANASDIDFFDSTIRYYQLKGPNGVMMLGTNLNIWSVESIKADFPVDTYATPDGKVSVIEGLFLTIPVINCDEVCQNLIMDAIKETRKVSEVSRIQQEVSKNSAQLYQLAKRGDSYSLRESTYQYKLLDPTLLDLCYEKVSVFMDREYENVPMSEIVEIQLDMLKNGKNIFVLGPTGVGKSTLAGSMWASLADAGFMVIKLDYDTIDGNQSEIQVALEEAINPYLEDRYYKGVTFVIDEARALFNDQKHSDVLLDIMDGIRKRQDFPMGVMISINAKMSELDPTLFRGGRTHMLTILDYMTAGRAHGLVKYIRDTRPDLVYNQQLLEDILKNGKVIEGVTIHGPGKISSADIWNTVFRTLEDHEKYTNRLKPYIKKGNPTPGPSANGTGAKGVRVVI